MLIISFSSVAEARVSIVDDFGKTVTLEKPATRIVALYGSFNEILYSMNLSNTIISRTSGEVFPKGIEKLPAIGTHMRPNAELIVSLKPDLVLQMAGRKQALTALAPLEKFNIPTAVFNVSTFDGLYSLIERLGVLTASENSGQALIKSMQKRLEKVTLEVSKLDHRPLIFFEVRYPNLLSAGTGSIVNDIIKKAGALNCVNLSKRIVRLGDEELIRLNPEVYVYQKGRMNPNPTAPELRSNFKPLRAVKNKKTLMVDESIFSRPSPRNVEAVELLSKFLVNHK